MNNEVEKSETVKFATPIRLSIETQKGKKKQIKTVMAKTISLDTGKDTPADRKGLMQSVLNFVSSSGKRGNELVSPDGAGNGNPEPKRVVKK